tara:strand:- start:266 stop:712 length:447 start_codon:yes stop_codon:yes gene_type:complete
MSIKFQKHTGNPNDFMQILPLDWQEALQMVWDDAKATSEIYVIKEDGNIIAGGILFKQYTLEMALFKQEAEALLAKHSYYIGYLWVNETHRGRDLGTLWLDSVKSSYPNTKFWLTIEEENLKNFYLKNDFHVAKEVENGGIKEWLLAC